MMEQDLILEVNHLSLSIAGRQGEDRLILKDVSMEIPRGRITCLVGESGSGKSLTVSAILGMCPQAACLPSESRILFHGESIYSVFQDPMNSLNPSVRVGRQLFQMAKGYGDLSKKTFTQRMVPILGGMKFDHPEGVLRRYPFELSGGMLQRLLIACGILIAPSLLVADEPTTALDVTTQKEILHTFREINRGMGMSIFVVTHDFGVVAEIADEVIVMQRGSIVERGDVFQVFDHPKQEYTKRLMQAAFKGSDGVCC